MKFNKTLGLILLSSALFGCAHELAPVDIPATANPSAELDSLKTDMSTARNNQDDVFAPEKFKQADKYLQEAEERSQKGKEGQKVLASVSQARAYLNAASEETQKANQDIKEVVTARSAALKAKANETHSKEFAKLDSDLKSDTAKLEDGKKLDTQEINSLQSKYLDLELLGIKSAKLGETQNLVRVAENKGAKKNVPKALEESKQKLNVAEKQIETDRHNDSAIDPAVAAAKASAQKSLELLGYAKNAKLGSPEQIARDLDKKNQDISAANEKADTAADVVNEQDHVIRNQGAALAIEAGANMDLQKKADMDKQLEKARKEFSSSEADVYRQGNNLIIRLKSMDFASGRADLPTKSMDVLNKVKDIISDISPGKVVVEGHTDGVGTATVNKKLSEKRAESVAHYFVADNAIDKDKVESVGYGFEKPIATNKTKEGRAENRRVDVIIEPEEKK